MKKIYPMIMFFSRITGKRSKVIRNQANIEPVQPVYRFTVALNNGKQLDLSSLRGKKILIVNTASDCGYTGQYAELQKLQEQFKQGLQVIGFPANDFREQEKGSDEEISRFCQVNYGVGFPLAKKSVAIRSSDQHPVFRWLTSKEENGWNEQQPSWNFSKFLIDENGMLTHYFDPSISPLATIVTDAVKKDH